MSNSNGGFWSKWFMRLVIIGSLIAVPWTFNRYQTLKKESEEPTTVNAKVVDAYCAGKSGHRSSVKLRIAKNEFRLDIQKRNCLKLVIGEEIEVWYLPALNEYIFPYHVEVKRRHIYLAVIWLVLALVINKFYKKYSPTSIPIKIDSSKSSSIY